MSVGDRHIVVATAASADSAQEWLECENVARVVALRRPSPSGKRWGRLAFGLGVDAAVVAVKTRLSTARRSPVLTTNPWIAAALRVLGHRNLVSIGIFAAPGSRTWALFRRLLQSCGMVVLSEVENANWSQAGGNSRFVRYGNSFPYPDVPSPERRAGRTAIFIGGASDRDHSLIDEFARHVLESGREIDLVIATGGSPSTESSESAVVTRLPSVTQREFGRLLASADVSFLPLVENGRSAGHMFIVGSLQVGTPVVFTKVKGMSEYEDSRYCRAVPRTEDALEFVLEAAAAAPGRDETRAFWERTYSRAAFRRSVLTAAMDMFQGARRDA